MTIQVFGLWPHELDRLASRTGKMYSFVVATVAAESEDEARRFAQEQDTLGLPWGNPEKFKCELVATFGDPPSPGRVFYQWTPA